MTQDEIFESDSVILPEWQLVERRRPGRRDASPELIALLRAQDSAWPACDDRDCFVLEREDGLAPARGIGIGVLFAVPMWGVIALGIHLVLR